MTARLVRGRQITVRAVDALEASEARVHSLKRALGRLASSERLITDSDDCVQELAARQRSARAVVLEGAAGNAPVEPKERDTGGLQSRPCEGSGGEPA